MTQYDKKKKFGKTLCDSNYISRRFSGQ